MNVDELTLEIELRRHHFGQVAESGELTCTCGDEYSNWEEHLSFALMDVVRGDRLAPESRDLHRRIRKLRKKVRRLRNELLNLRYEKEALSIIAVDPALPRSGVGWLRRHAFWHRGGEVT